MAENPGSTSEAPQAPTSSGAGNGFGNPRDIQGILALAVIGGTFAVAGVAIYINVQNAVSVLASVLPLAGTIVGFYFGQKSQTQQ